MAKEGLPRERRGTRSWRYELRACEDWANANGERLNAERLRIKAEAKKTVTMEEMRIALSKIGSRLQ